MKNSAADFRCFKKERQFIDKNLIINRINHQFVKMTLESQSLTQAGEAVEIVIALPKESEINIRRLRRSLDNLTPQVENIQRISKTRIKLIFRQQGESVVTLQELIAQRMRDVLGTDISFVPLDAIPQKRTRGDKILTPISFNERELFERAYRTKLNFFRRTMTSRRIPPQDQEDVLQDVLLTVLGKVGSGEVRDITGFLVGTFRKKLTMYWRSRRVREGLVQAVDTEILMLSAKPEEDTTIESLPDRQALELALMRLPPKMRKLLIMKYVHGYNPTEIAQSLGYHNSSIRKVKRRALVAMGGILESIVNRVSLPLTDENDKKEIKDPLPSAQQETVSLGERIKTAPSAPYEQRLRAALSSGNEAEIRNLMAEDPPEYFRLTKNSGNYF